MPYNKNGIEIADLRDYCREHSDLPRKYNKFTLEEMDAEKEKLINFVRNHPAITSSLLRCTEFESIFNQLYKGKINQLKIDAGVPTRASYGRRKYHK